MKLLIITQKVDKEDPVLGFFHNWLEELAEKFEKIYVICLQKGNYSLPENIAVFSLGKEKSKNKLKYIFNFFYFSIVQLRNYESIFVHMNQEYILLGGVFWKMLGKKIYFWRNHPQGSLLTRIAVWLSDKVFYTSSGSYTAKFKKAVKMPAGVDIESFKPQTANRKKNSILSLGRISPIKNIHILIEALKILDERKINFKADIYGNPLPKDESYYNSLKTKTKELGLESKIKFYSSVPNYQTPKIYNEHTVFVNLTPSGSFDKTILEAALCGCIPIITNESIAGEIPRNLITEIKPLAVADKIEYWLKANADEQDKIIKEFGLYVSDNHGLDVLIDKLAKEINREIKDE